MEESVSSTTRRVAIPGFDWQRALDFLGQRAVEGIETVDGSVYRRVVRHGDVAVTVALTWDPTREELVLTSHEASGDLETERFARAFDAGLDPAAVTRHLSCDPWLAPLVDRPLHVIGGPDPFEVAVRAILGQQVSIGRARMLNGRLVRRCGAVRPDAVTGEPTPLFPTPEEVLAADLSDLGVPGARVRGLGALAEAALADPDLFGREGPLDAIVDRLRAIRGVGPWTAHYVAMRACRHPDAFPASDVGLLRGAARGGRRPTPAELSARAEAWRPYRAYAAQALWAADASG